MVPTDRTAQSVLKICERLAFNNALWSQQIEPRNKKTLASSESEDWLPYKAGRLASLQ